MLKIKDDKDLRELEQFGLVIKGYKPNHYILDKDWSRHYIPFLIDIRTREVSLHCHTKEVQSLLFDLIKANFIEKRS